jgi:hypothetical protein
MYFFLVSFLLLGAGLKYIDDAFDEKVFNKKLALVLAPFLGILWAYTMIIDQFSATILLAILLGVLAKGKIDNYAHLIGLAVIMLVLIFAGVNLLFLPLIFIATAAFLDELGNDIIDKNKDYFDDNKFLHKITLYFFDQRWLTKITVLYVVLIGLFPIYFFLAILLFDGAYLTVRLYTKSRQQTRKITYA